VPAVADPPVVEPAVLPLALLEPMCALVSMNPLPLVEDADDGGVEVAVEPEVPVAPLELPDCRQPVTVIGELLLLLELLVVCAAATAPASATATHVPNHT